LILVFRLLLVDQKNAVQRSALTVQHSALTVQRFWLPGLVSGFGFLFSVFCFLVLGFWFKFLSGF